MKNLLSCKTLRVLSVGIIGLILLGSGLIFGGSLMPPQGLLPSLTLYSGFFMLLCVPFIILGTAALSLLPGVERSLWGCLQS